MPTPVPPDTLAIVNARVWTGDPRRPWADAVLVRGDRIALVGSSAEVRKRAGSSPVVDAKGRMLTPGITAAGVGVLAPGAPADLTILDRELVRVTLEALREAGVVLTMTAGHVAYDRDGMTR